MNITKLIAKVGLAALMVVSSVSSAFAVDSTIVVKPTDLATGFADVISNPTKWFYYNDENDSIDNTLGTYVVGPAVSPLGQDSVAISVSGTQRRNLATYRFSGTPLADITKLAFSTYNPSVGNGGSISRSGYLHFNVDFNGSDTWQRRLVYVPSVNGTVLQDAWQEWDTATASSLWSYSGATWPAPGAMLPGTTAKTWATILSEYPGVRVRVTDSFMGMRVGEPYADGYTENLDAFKFGTASGITSFDFDMVDEPVLLPPPTTKNQCKNNGWMTFNNPPFTSKKDCEKYVKDHKKDGKAEGELKLSGPSQKIKFEVKEMMSGDDHDDDDHDDRHERRDGLGKVEYWNYDYPGGLHYKTQALCVNVNKVTKEARFMFQIPSGHPGLSGLYIVAYTKDVLPKGATDLYGHAATADLATATTWCETGVGFSPAMYSLTKGKVEVK